MANKLERIINIIMMVIIDQRRIVKFGSPEHYELIDIFEAVKSVDEIKYIDNIAVRTAIDYISKDDELLHIVENEIEVDINELKYVK